MYLTCFLSGKKRYPFLCALIGDTDGSSDYSVSSTEQQLVPAPRLDVHASHNPPFLRQYYKTNMKSGQSAPMMYSQVCVV